MAREDDAPSSGQPGPLDKIFRDTNKVLLIVFGVCCSGIAFILGLIGMLTAKDPVAKKNATTVVIISVAVVIFWVVLNVVAGVGAIVAGPPK
jgi:Mn2+/Fe2+ NRAMP family transporter